MNALMQEDVKFISEERRSERAGRTKAERELRELQLRLSQLDPEGGAAPGDGEKLPLDLQQVGGMASRR